MKRRFLAAVLTLLAMIMPGVVQDHVHAEPLKIVHVNAPAVNCKFDPSCKVVANDFVTDFAWSSSANDSFLQSRTFPQGKPGTAAAGLYAYLYRIDLSKAMAATGYTCVKTFSIPFGPVEAVDYSGSGTASQVFVITTGGLGSIAPVNAVQFGKRIVFSFEPLLCNGGQPGKGGMTFFFGLSSKNPSYQAISSLEKDIGASLGLKALVPKIPSGKKAVNPAAN